MLHDDVADCEDGTDVCYDSKNQLMTSKCFKCFDGIKTISLTQVQCTIFMGRGCQVKSTYILSYIHIYRFVTE